jgi:hypothetical protein
VLAATVGIGHGRVDPEAVFSGGIGLCVCASAGEVPGVVDEVVGEDDVIVDAEVVTVVVEVVGVGGTEGLGATSLATPSFSRHRLMPRDVLSLRPNDVALIRI